MKAAVKMARTKTVANAESRLETFIGKFAPDHQKIIRDCRKVLRRRFRGANELVYDNYNFFVIGYSPTERPSDTIVSLAAGASGIGLAFPYCGTRLPDPHRLLLGSGSKNRFIRLESAKVMARHDVSELISAAVELSKVPLPQQGSGKLIIRSVSAKQRSRRK